MTVLLSVLVTAIVVSHQLTPGMLVVTLVALVFTRRYRHWVPAVTTVVIFLAWCLTAALPFLSRRHAGHDSLHRRRRRRASRPGTGHPHRRRSGGDLLGGPAAFGFRALLALVGVLRQRVLRHRALPLLLVAARAAADVRGEQLRQRDDLPES
ncbi:LMBR1 domain-containing protein [Streptomyces thinghirensis]|nr:LMBR1 domain-containing protein [Streptomyces thinghirensis]